MSSCQDDIVIMSVRGDIPPDYFLQFAGREDTIKVTHEFLIGKLHAFVCFSDQATYDAWRRTAVVFPGVKTDLIEPQMCDLFCVRPVRPLRMLHSRKARRLASLRTRHAV